MCRLESSSLTETNECSRREQTSHKTFLGSVPGPEGRLDTRGEIERHWLQSAVALGRIADTDLPWQEHWGPSLSQTLTQHPQHCKTNTDRVLSLYPFGCHCMSVMERSNQSAKLKTVSIIGLATVGQGLISAQDSISHSARPRRLSHFLQIRAAGPTHGSAPCQDTHTDTEPRGAMSTPSHGPAP
eukprot:5147446-Pleurochrysis_carterae.AAC.1